jgi:signal transduction histidine kinase
MRATGSLRLRQVELAWAAFVGLNLSAMAAFPHWETIPFHLIWLTMTLLYGFTVWRLRSTALVLGGVAMLTGALILQDAFHGTQVWGELFEVPLMSAMFLAMVWHARRRKEAMRELASVADERAALLDRQESFLHDVSHALRTPITIARGHVEMARRAGGPGLDGFETRVAIDELDRMERIVRQLLMIAKAQAATLSERTIELDELLEDVAMRWSEISPRVWRVGRLARGTVCADPDALRAALDALLENAVRHTEATAVIELRSRAAGGEVTIEVADEGSGIAGAALGLIFDRFARGDDRTEGGIGLGLSIVDAIARAHGGRCAVRSSPDGSTFSLVLPGFQPRVEAAVAVAGLAADER